MRNAQALDTNYVVTIDNSGCIGEKPADLVQVPNDIAAYFTMRVALLEQWCAGAKPVQILLANFTGDVAWAGYEKGIRRVFDEIDQPIPALTGSTETNFASLQSALSITVIGKRDWTPRLAQCVYFVVGKPLVGAAVLEQAGDVAHLKELYRLREQGMIQAIWPTGSKGIGHEIKRFIGEGSCTLDCETSAGPSTAVLVAVDSLRVAEFLQKVQAPVTQIDTKLTTT